MRTLDTLTATFKVPTPAPSPVWLAVGRLELSRLLAALGFTRGAEIGVWTGKWSARLCLDNPRLQMLAVDPWASYDTYRDSRNLATVLTTAYEEATTRLRAFPCTIVRKASLDAARDVPDGSLDFVYIDANHGDAFVQADLEAWAPKVRPDGIVAGHDYLWRPGRPHIQVKAAVDRYVKDHAIAPLFVLAADPIPSFAWVNA
jgi:hypothetical protein